MSKRSSRPKKTIVRIERVDLRGCTPEEREPWMHKLYALVSEFFEPGEDGVAAFYRAFVEDGDMVMGICYGSDGRLAGLVNISCHEFDFEGKPHAVFVAGGYFRLEYTGAERGSLFGLREVLQYKMTHLRTKVGYMPVVLNPAGYRMINRFSSRAYPSVERPTPDHIRRLALTMAKRRGLRVVDDRQWLMVSFGGARPRFPERIMSGRGMHDDVFVQYYQQLAPQWRQGRVPLIWVPLDLPNIVLSAMRAGRRELERWHLLAPRPPPELAAGAGPNPNQPSSDLI